MTVEAIFDSGTTKPGNVIFYRATKIPILHRPIICCQVHSFVCHHSFGYTTTMHVDCINLPSIILLAKFYLDIAQILSHPSSELILEQVSNAKLLEIVSNIGQEMPIEHVQRSSLVHSIAPCNNVHPGHIGACSLCKLTIASKFIQQHSQ